jgi:hypothetical protein
MRILPSVVAGFAGWVCLWAVLRRTFMRKQTFLATTATVTLLHAVAVVYLGLQLLDTAHISDQLQREMGRPTTPAEASLAAALHCCPLLQPVPCFCLTCSRPVQLRVLIFTLSYLLYDTVLTFFQPDFKLEMVFHHVAGVAPILFGVFAQRVGVPPHCMPAAGGLFVLL